MISAKLIVNQMLINHSQLVHLLLLIFNIISILIPSVSAQDASSTFHYYEYTKPLTIGNYTCYDYVYNARARRSFQLNGTTMDHGSMAASSSSSYSSSSSSPSSSSTSSTIPMGVAYRNSPYRSQNKQEMIKFHGDINIGGLFPMHDAGDEQHLCGSIKEGKGIQRMEAMLYAIDMINNDTNLLPNLTLGVHILDTCSRDTYALEQTMEFVKSSLTTVDHTLDDYQCDDGSSPHLLASDPVVGVIGAASSSVSIMIANILRLFQIPQISYASTSVELSDKSRFGFFSRVVPPDNFQAQVMVDIVKLFNWTYVSTIAEEGDYGERGIEYFKSLAAREKICIAEGVKIGRNWKHEDFVRIVNKLYTKSNARGVVLFVDEDNCRKLLNASQATGKVGHFAWLGSDSWGRKLYPVRGQEDSAVGAITILPKRNSLPGFDEYFKSLTPLANKRNPWFKPFWEQHFNCYFPDTGTSPEAASSISDNFKPFDRKMCTGNEVLVKYEQEGLVPFVVDAVYAMAHAIHNLLADRCRPKALKKPLPLGVNESEPAVNESSSGGSNSTSSNSFWFPENQCIRDPIKGQELLSYIRKVSFPSLQGMIVKFNKDGDAPGRYDIFQYQRVRGSSLLSEDDLNSSDYLSTASEYDYIKIGNWESEKLVFNLSQLEWPNFGPVSLTSNDTAASFDRGSIPSSVCSKDCDRGQFRQIHEGQPCCWHCSHCAENEKIYNQTDCVACPSGYVPNEFKEVCTKLPLEYMRWNSPWTIVPAVFASLGIVATVFTFMTFIRFNETPIIMASGRELCYILLLGLMVCYIVSLLILSKPTLLTCTVVRIGLCLGLCICYSAILTKTNRISRIFNRGVKSGLKRPSYTSPRSQVVICTCLVSVQLVFIVAWLIRDPPSVKEVIQKLGSRTVAVLQCGISATATAISLIYNMILILLCTMYAFKTRKIPDNFNEAKYIVFTMYSTCIVWLAFIPIYFGTNNDFKIQLASLSTCISISAAVNIGCLFTPKLYICLFQPYKNTRHSGTQGSGGVGTFTSNSTSNALRFARPTSSGGCAAAIAAATQAISAHQSAPTIVLPEPSSGDLKTTSTTNGDWNSPSPEDEQNSAI